jgi:hypothetical protein
MKKLFLWLITILIIAVFSLVGCNAKAAVKEVEVDSSNPEGVKFVAPESGSYEITIVGGLLLSATRRPRLVSLWRLANYASPIYKQTS